MTHYLRDKDNHTIVDVEAAGKSTVVDITVVVSITFFARFLLNLPEHKQPKFTEDMHAMQELRGEYWEQYGTVSQETTNQLAERRCKEMVKAWGLTYVTD